MSSDFLISLRLADRSFFPLFRPGEWGEKTMVLSAAKEEQEKMELLFFFDSGGESVEPLTEIVLTPDQIPGGSWTDLTLKLKLSRTEGLYIRILSKGVPVDTQEVMLPVDLGFRSEEYNEQIQQEESRRFSVSFSLTFAAVFFILSLAGAFFMGRVLSSDSPPPLMTQQHQEYSEPVPR